MEINKEKYKVSSWEALASMAETLARQLGGNHTEAIRRLVRMNPDLAATRMPPEIASAVQNARGKSKAQPAGTSAKQVTPSQRPSDKAAKGGSARPWKEVIGHMEADARGEKEKPEGDNLGWHGVMEKIEGQKRPSKTVR